MSVGHDTLAWQHQIRRGGSCPTWIVSIRAVSLADQCDSSDTNRLPTQHFYPLSWGAQDPIIRGPLLWFLIIPLSGEPPALLRAGPCIMANAIQTALLLWWINWHRECSNSKRGKLLWTKFSTYRFYFSEAPGHSGLGPNLVLSRTSNLAEWPYVTRKW